MIHNPTEQCRNSSYHDVNTGRSKWHAFLRSSLRRRLRYCSSSCGGWATGLWSVPNIILLCCSRQCARAPTCRRNNGHTRKAASKGRNVHMRLDHLFHPVLQLFLHETHTGYHKRADMKAPVPPTQRRVVHVMPPDLHCPRIPYCSPRPDTKMCLGRFIARHIATGIVPANSLRQGNVALCIIAVCTDSAIRPSKLILRRLPFLFLASFDKEPNPSNCKRPGLGYQGLPYIPMSRIPRGLTPRCSIGVVIILFTSTPQCTSINGLMVSIRWYLGRLEG